jgi:mono/diheme cytochrome c family protein
MTSDAQKFSTKIALTIALAAVFSALPLNAQDSSENSGGAQSAFRTKCSGCHGADGSGNTDVGRTLKVPDLHSPEVQKQTSAQLADVITNGKNSRMPPFKSILTTQQIQDLVQYIRHLPSAQKSE